MLQLNQGKDALRVVAYVTIYLVAFNNSLLFGFQKFFMEIRQSKEKKTQNRKLSVPVRNEPHHFSRVLGGDCGQLNLTESGWQRFVTFYVLV